MRVAMRCVTVAAVAALAAGCGIGYGTGDGSLPPGGSPADDPAGRVDRSIMEADERTAVDATDTFWRNHFAELFGRPYRAPEVAGGYLGTAGPRCSGERSVSYNAFYCPTGDFLAWDENLMAAGYLQIGDAWVYLIIAHEWGHSIQARLERSRVSVAAELQADCLAGASLQGAADDGLIQIEAGDAEEIGQTLVAVADDYPWTSQRDHGNARERIGAFNSGARGGVDACA